MIDIHLRVLPRVWSTGADWEVEEQEEEEEETVLDTAGENRTLDNSDLLKSRIWKVLRGIESIWKSN